MCLQKDRLQNVSPKLNQYFSTKPESLAGKFKTGVSIASLAKNKLPLEKILKVNQRMPQAIGREQSTSQKTQIITQPPNKLKSSSDNHKLPSWLYWILGSLILVGVGVLFGNSRKGS